MLFGSIVLAVSLDVPITLLRRFLPLQRPAALILVVVVILGTGGWVGLQLLPELLQQIQQLVGLVPQVSARLAELLRQQPALANLEHQLLAGNLLDRLQPLGAQVLGVAGGAANLTMQLLLMALLAEIGRAHV